MVVPRVKDRKRKTRCRRELVVLNYYLGCPFDFTLELHKIESSIERHKARIELGDKYDIEMSAFKLPDLISDLRCIKDMLNGRFDILVIEEDEKDVTKENDNQTNI